MEPWTTDTSEVAYSCEGFDIVREGVTLPSGAETHFDYLAEGESVVILPFTVDGTVVVIDEWRHAVRRVNHGLPAGSLEADETPEAAAYRELAEETGYDAGEIEHMTTVEPANGFADAVFHYFVARDCTPSAEQSLDGDETISVSTQSFDALEATVRNGELRDGRSAFAVQAYLLQRTD